MSAGPGKPRLPLTLIKGSRTKGDERSLGSRVSEIDWSILMARAQPGDSDAYVRLLTEISPYVRTLASRRGLDQNEIEDALQDVLLG
jgi:RNA polymerase sigma-70 factor (ECF subfamily)